MSYTKLPNYIKEIAGVAYLAMAGVDPERKAPTLYARGFTRTLAERISQVLSFWAHLVPYYSQALVDFITHIHCRRYVIFEKRRQVFHWVSKEEKTVKITWPQAECFYYFTFASVRVFGNSMRHEARVYSS